MSDGLLVRGAEVRFGSRTALAGVDLQVAAGEVVAILGPSGCGKSTLLRAVAGLVPLAAGAVFIDGADMAGLRTHRRGVGLMFADHALFPHLDTAGNVGFGLRMAGWDRGRASSRIDQMLELVGLADRAGSRVQELSQGQQQRVALARTLAPQPRLVMLDEPMGALDRVLRRELTAMVSRALAETAATALLVTHDRDEAFAQASRVGLMREGRIVQIGPPGELFARPADDWVAGFLADSEA
jgi:thiamine transport system ATP-binding protein